jgi:DNA polymerase III epsilon subunit family exonuclease
VDVETSGASASWGDRVIEVGIARFEAGRKVAEYQQLLDPGRGIGPGITALTGITNDMVRGQPTFGDQLPAMLDLLRGAVILGHNVRFDLSFLTAEFRRQMRRMADDLPGAPVLDTVRIARRRFGRGGNGLQNLSRRLGIDPTTAHRALADALTTAAVFEKLIEPIGGWRISLVDAFLAQGGPMGIESERKASVLPLELEEALEHGGAVEMDYVDAGNNRTTRVVRPLQIRRFRGEMLLVAHCQLRGDRRNFKVDRIVTLRKVDTESDVGL